MKISEERLQTMYGLAGVNKQTLHDALRVMGKKHLKTKLMKEGWTHDNPTKNYCYVIAEFVYYYLSPRGSKPYKLPGIPGDDGLHRFIMWPDYSVVDLAVDQFPNFEDVDYTKAKKCYFMVNTFGVPGPSKRTRILAELMGYELSEERAIKVNTKSW
jgi:hypothetical protein